MEVFAVAQIIGTFGYIIYIVSSRFEKRSYILVTEAVGCIIIAFHWYLLGEMITVFTNLITLYSAILGVLIVRFSQVSFIQVLAYPMLCIAAYFSFDGSVAFYIAVIASSTLLTAKLFKNIQSLRAISLAASILWTIYGLLVMSLPATLFGLFFSLGHASKLWQSLAKKNNMTTYAAKAAI